MTIRSLPLLLSFSAALLAQSSNGYLFFAPGGVSGGGHTTMTLSAGAGGEGIIGKGFGAGAELGFVGPRRYLSESLGQFSANGYYHFLRSRTERLDPYATAGYTLFFRNGTANLFNFGGGANYWFADKVGLKVEMRDHVWRQGSTAHFWGVRFGVAFRSGS